MSQDAPKVEEAIVPLPEVRLGMLSMNPKELVKRATELATALADIIHAQKDADGKPTLYVIIKNKKYVKCEGWVTLGAMVGVVPIEESCEALPDGHGYKAKIKLIRLNDGMQVGGASAICKIQEKGWENSEEFSTYSKTITRATGKAFRLSFAWIMKLAGFEPTPADELWEVEGSKEETDGIAKGKIEKHLGMAFATLAEAESAYIKTKKSQTSPTDRPSATTGLSYSLPNGDQPGSYALVVGSEGMLKLYKDTLGKLGGRPQKGDKGVLVPIDKLPDLQYQLEQNGFVLKRL